MHITRDEGRVLSSAVNISSVGNISSDGSMSSADSTPSTIGGAVTSGIQDISALASLLGSEQCEEHVGSSLVGGFLYTSASSLSIFGSLGIVRAGLKALVASVALASRGKEGMGAKKLDDMGLNPAGKVLSQIMWRGECHIGETQLDKTLEELHITDVEKLTVDAVRWKWNVWMLITSTITIILSITPYIYLIRTNENNRGFLRWFVPIFFPLSRSIGSLIVSTTIQIIIQTRLLGIIGHRLIFLTLDKFVRDEKIEEHHNWREWWDARFSSEVSVSHLQTHIKNSINAKSPENSGDTSNERLVSLFKSLETRLKTVKAKHLPTATRLRHTTMLRAAQILLAFGLILMVVGYVGCFDIVQSNETEFGPLSWLLIELGLSVVRMVLWGWNPAWDEEQTYLTFNLELARHSPLSTCNKFSEELEKAKDIPLTSSSNFLASITSFVGLLEPLKVPDGFALYYTMTRRKSDGGWVLYVTMVDYRVNISWTLVFPKRPESQNDRRVSTVHLKSDDINTVWAKIEDESSENVNDTSVDHVFVGDLKAHCDSILRKLRTHTFLEALVHVLAEVAGMEAQAKRFKATLANAVVATGIPLEANDPSLESRLLDVMVARPVQMSRHAHAQVLKQANTLKHALKQRHKQEMLEQANTLRQVLQQELAQEQRLAGTMLAERVEPEVVLAEVTVLGLVLAQRQEDKRRLELAEAMTEVAVEVMALGQDAKQAQEALDLALWLALLLKQATRDKRVLTEVQTEVQIDVQKLVLAQELLGTQAQTPGSKHASRQALQKAPQKTLQQTSELWQQQDQTLGQMRTQILVLAMIYARAPAKARGKDQVPRQESPPALARTLARAQERERAYTQNVEATDTQTRMNVELATDTHRPPLKIKLTWELGLTEEIEQMGGAEAHPYNRRPLTDDDQDDMAYLRMVELASHKQLLCSRRYEWAEGIYSIVKDTLTETTPIPEITQSPKTRLGQTRNYAASDVVITEIRILFGVQQMEWTLIAESSELERILKERSTVVVNALQTRRARDWEDAPLVKITDDRRANARRRVNEEAIRAQRRLEKLRKEAQARIKEGNRNGHMSLLNDRWRDLQDSIRGAWKQLTKSAEQGTEPDFGNGILTPTNLCKLAQLHLRGPERMVQLEGELDMMQERLRKANILGYVGFLDEYRSSRTSTFLLRLLLSKNSKFVRLPSDRARGNGFTAIAAALTQNDIVACVDCTACTLDEVVKIIESSLKVQSVTLILPTRKEVLEDPKLEAALMERKNILSLNLPGVSYILKRAIQAHRTAAEGALTRGDHDEPLVYYECVEMDGGCSYLMFKRPGASTCTVSFTVPADQTVHGAAGAHLVLRLVHCRMSSTTKVDIHLNDGTDNIPWDWEKCPQDDFGVQDIVLPTGDILDEGVNRFTITLARDENVEDGSYFRDAYRIRDVQLVWY